MWIVDFGLRWSVCGGDTEEQRDSVITRLTASLEEAVLSVKCSQPVENPKCWVLYLSAEQQDGKHFPWTVVATNFRSKPELHSL